MNYVNYIIKDQKMSSRWTTENSEYLKENHGKIGNQQIADTLGFSIQYIQRKANTELDFKKSPWDEDKLTFLKENWESLSYPQISEIIGVNTKTIAKKARSLGFIKGRCMVTKYDQIDLVDEKWEPIKDFENYKISNMGRVVSLKTNTVLIQNLNGRGYYRFMVWKNNKNTGIDTHVLVTNYFLGDKPTGYQINHIDGDKSNNKVSNLEYITPSENMQHARDNNLHPGAYNSLSEDDVHRVCKLFEDNGGDISPIKLISQLSITTSISNVLRIKYRKNWVSISKNYKW